MKDEDSVVFVLVRHGRTGLNRAGRYRGRSDAPLDELGMRQAQRLAERLGVMYGAGRGWRGRLRVGSSPLPRTLQTATPIAEALDAPVQIFDGLTDLDYGAWQGLAPAEAAGRDPELYARWRGPADDVAPPEGESLGALQSRAVGVLQRCLSVSRAGDTWILVAHEIVWRSVFCWALDVPLSRRDQFGQDPAALNVLDLAVNDARPPLLRTVNDTSHLAGLGDANA